MRDEPLSIVLLQGHISKRGHFVLLLIVVSFVLFIGPEKCAEGIVAIVGHFCLASDCVCSLLGAIEKIPADD